MLTGVILAGGRNSRMNGYNKALLLYKEERFIVRQVRLMRELCRKIIIVTETPDVIKAHVKNEVVYVADIHPGNGPLGGLQAAFQTVDTEFAWVVGCDYPEPSPRAAKLMLERLRKSHYDAVIPVAGRSHQMLHGVYRPKPLLQEITVRMDAGIYRLSGLLDSIRWLPLEEEDWRQAGIDLKFTRDVDTPEQYLELLSAGDKGGGGS
ncbi:molybdenum cofactor guanylyltransferase [Gorillibacterium massiliense]|uniref:molybdenum cofactor guanylyltransferase n=1 Tax=Gorillibacterium massiliense TaxID=1280390 RepID=UPI0004B7DA0E|nr:molybdenum cofactor guanylyltransferase [Gorillibacterium massiliense]